MDVDEAPDDVSHGRRVAILFELPVQVEHVLGRHVLYAAVVILRVVVEKVRRKRLDMIKTRAMFVNVFHHRVSIVTFAQKVCDALRLQLLATARQH